MPWGSAAPAKSRNLPGLEVATRIRFAMIAANLSCEAELKETSNPGATEVHGENLYHDRDVVIAGFGRVMNHAVSATPRLSAEIQPPIRQSRVRSKFTRMSLVPGGI